MKGPIRSGHRVRSADGTEYDVRYVHEASQTADVSPVGDAFDSGNYITLPLAELTRITKVKRTPIEGMPEKRARCPYCDRPLQPHLQQIREDGRDRFDTTTIAGATAWTKLRIVKRVFKGWRGYPIERGNLFDKFCTLGCAREFANAAFRAGYRIKRKGQTS